MTPDVLTRLEQFFKMPKFGTIATIGENVLPHLTPNYYIYTEGKITMSITRERLKYRNLSRDSRLTVCIYSEPSTTDYTVVSGNSIIQDDDFIVPNTQAIIERYVTPVVVDERLRDIRMQNRILAYLAPSRVLLRN